MDLRWGCPARQGPHAALSQVGASNITNFNKKSKFHCAITITKQITICAEEVQHQTCKRDNKGHSPLPDLPVWASSLVGCGTRVHLKSRFLEPWRRLAIDFFLRGKLRRFGLSRRDFWLV